MNDILKGLSEKTPCEFKGCEGLALPLSTPPLCAVHVNDIDGWYVNFRTQLASLNVSEKVSGINEMIYGFSLSMGHELYKSALLQNPIRSELYKDFKNRVDPREEVQFSFDAIIYFVIAAAASGIVGNFTYDALKEVIRRIGKKKNDSKMVNCYESTISVTKYESLRVNQHHDSPPSLEITPDIEVELEIKYSLIIREKKS